MIDPREPIVIPVPVEDLRPTQITVGLREVALKRQMIQAQEIAISPASKNAEMFSTLPCP